MRQLKGNWNHVVVALAMALAAFHLLTGVFGLLPAQEQRAVHVGLGLTLVLALYPARKSGAGKTSIPWWDILLILLILVATGNIFVNWMQYMPFMKDPATPFEQTLAVIAILLPYY